MCKNMKFRELTAISCDVCDKEIGWVRNSTRISHYFCVECGIRNPLSQYPFCKKHPKKLFKMNDKKCNICGDSLQIHEKPHTVTRIDDG